MLFEIVLICIFRSIHRLWHRWQNHSRMQSILPHFLSCWMVLPSSTQTSHSTVTRSRPHNFHFDLIDASCHLRLALSTAWLGGGRPSDALSTSDAHGESGMHKKIHHLIVRLVGLGPLKEANCYLGCYATPYAPAIISYNYILIPTYKIAG